jgi:hypothetical protein
VLKKFSQDEDEPLRGKLHEERGRLSIHMFQRCTGE